MGVLALTMEVLMSSVAIAVILSQVTSVKSKSVVVWNQLLQKIVETVGLV